MIPGVGKDGVIAGKVGVREIMGVAAGVDSAGVAVLGLEVDVGVAGTGVCPAGVGVRNTGVGVCVGMSGFPVHP